MINMRRIMRNAAALQRCNRRTVCGVPQPDCPVAAAGGNIVAVGVPRDHIHIRLVA